MKRTGSILLLSLLVGSCTGLDKHAGDTFYPLNNPNAPDAQGETARRVRGEALSTTPILPEEGDIWPGQPDPVPSLRDVSRDNPHVLDKWRQARPQLDADLKHQLADGQGMAAGENVGRDYGSGKDVMPTGDRPLPTHVHDNAQPYLEPVSKGIVSIPNGDGTVTLIAPDGSVKIVMESRAAAFRKVKSFRHESFFRHEGSHRDSSHHDREVAGSRVKRTVPAVSRTSGRRKGQHAKAVMPEKRHKTTARHAVVSGKSTEARKKSPHHHKHHQHRSAGRE